MLLRSLLLLLSRLLRNRRQVANSTAVPVLRALPGVLILNGVIQLAVLGQTGAERVPVDQLPAALIVLVVHAVTVAESADDVTPFSAILLLLEID